MTIPFYIEDPNTWQPVKVPYDIVQYCDTFAPMIDRDAPMVDREDLQYVDCVWMHMGYYGNDPKLLKRMRQEYFSRPNPVFE
jgi:hypothetical protein